MEKAAFDFSLRGWEGFSQTEIRIVGEGVPGRGKSLKKWHRWSPEADTAWGKVNVCRHSAGLWQGAGDEVRVS